MTEKDVKVTICYVKNVGNKMQEKQMWSSFFLITLRAGINLF